MRLICGLFRLDSAPASEDLLRRMVAQMEIPRLRPALAIRMDGPAGLAVLDFSIEGPLSLPERRGAIMAADVRLDEPGTLASAVGCRSSEADDALLLSALEAFGPEGLDRVLGDLAFASWDGGKQALTCGRDIFGIRPFVYAYRPGELFAFASFPKAMHGAGIVPKRIDEIALARRVLRGVQARDSLIAGIVSLPPAHFIQVSREGLALERYFQFDRASIGTRRCTTEQAAAELRRLIDQAVACRLPKRGEAGAHLSGGLDSSAIAVLAARKLREQGRRLHAYSVLDRQRNDIVLEDESEFVQSVLDQERDIDWTPVRPPAALPLGNVPLDPDKAVGLGPEQAENMICARAEAQGVGLILSGWGGDEAATFNGRSALFGFFRRGRWRRLARELSALSRERGWPRWQTFRGHVLWPLMPRWLADRGHRMLGRNPPLPVMLHAVLSEPMRRRMGKPSTARPGPGRNIAENRWQGITGPHLTNEAEAMAATAARHGLAYAFPLLDRRVVEFALSLPNDLFLRDGFGRRVFRDAMAGVLPDRVRLHHQKMQSTPSRSVDLAASKDELLAKLDGFEKNEAIRRVIDLDHLRREIALLQTPERLYEEMLRGDQPTDAYRMAAVKHALAAAIYIDQHGAG